MDKTQLKLLQRIRDIGSYDYSNSTNEEKQILFYLSECKYIRNKATGSANQNYIITELGKSVISTERQEKVKVWFPIVTSIIALVISLVHLIVDLLT